MFIFNRVHECNECGCESEIKMWTMSLNKVNSAKKQERPQKNFLIEHKFT